MTLQQKTEEYTLTLSKEEVVDIAEGLDQGSRHRLDAAEVAAKAGQHAEKSPTLERKRSDRYSELRKALLDLTGTAESWHT